MNKKAKLIVWILAIVLVLAGIFILQMRDFAKGVVEDAKKKRDFKETKLNDSTTIKFEKVK